VSLVSEALRKARQEAAEREGRERGIPRGLVLPPKRWSSRPGLALAILIALAAAIAGAGIAWWALSRPVAVPSVPGAFAPAATTPPVSSAQDGRNATEAPARPAAAGRDQDRALSAFPTPQPQAALVIATTSPAPQTAPGSAQPKSVTAAEKSVQHPEQAGGGSRDRAFVVDADLGYAKLHLDYVVYRPGSPFAGINGQQVIIGSVIEGLQVEEIGPELVRLRDRRGVVVLRTH
jgi:hypothetical protein